MQTSDDLPCTDEIKVYQDEGEDSEEQARSAENLAEEKVELVIESEGQIPKLFDILAKNGDPSSFFKMPLLGSSPRLSNYFLPGYPAAIAAVMASLQAARSSHSNQNPTPTTSISTGLVELNSGGGSSFSGWSNSSSSCPSSTPQDALLGSFSQQQTPNELFRQTPEFPSTTKNNYFSSHEAFSKIGSINPFGFMPNLMTNNNSFSPRLSQTRPPVSYGLEQPNSNLDSVKSLTTISPDERQTWKNGSPKLDASKSETQKPNESIYAACASVLSAMASNWKSNPNLFKNYPRSPQERLGALMLDDNPNTPLSPTISIPKLNSPISPRISREDTSTLKSFSSHGSPMGAYNRMRSEPNSATSKNRSMEQSPHHSPSIFATQMQIFAAMAAKSLNSSPGATPTMGVRSPQESLDSNRPLSLAANYGPKSPVNNESIASPLSPWQKAVAFLANSPVAAAMCGKLGGPPTPGSNPMSPFLNSTVQDDDVNRSPGRKRQYLKHNSIHSNNENGLPNKRPLNAFMLFMREMRAKVQEEHSSLKESSAINQLLGKKWNELPKEEQLHYYDMAKREKLLHQLANNNETNNSQDVSRLPQRTARLRRTVSLNLSRSVSQCRATKLRSSSYDSYLASKSHLTHFISPSSESNISQAFATIANDETRKRIRSFLKSLTTSSASSPSRFNPLAGGVKSPISPFSAEKLLSSPVRNGSQNHLNMNSPNKFNSNQDNSFINEDHNRTHISNSGLNINYMQNNGQISNSSFHPYINRYHGFGASADHGFHRQSNGSHQPFPPGAQKSNMQYQSHHQNLSMGRTQHNSQSGRPGRPSHLHQHQNLIKSQGLVGQTIAAMAVGEISGGSMKKCRARFGLEHQNLWCKPCRRKKKCIRFISENDTEENENNKRSNRGLSEFMYNYQSGGDAFLSASLFRNSSDRNQFSNKIRTGSYQSAVSAAQSNGFPQVAGLHNRLPLGSDWRNKLTSGWYSNTNTNNNNNFPTGSSSTYIPSDWSLAHKNMPQPDSPFSSFMAAAAKYAANGISHKNLSQDPSTMLSQTHENKQRLFEGTMLGQKRPLDDFMSNVTQGLSNSNPLLANSISSLPSINTTEEDYNLERKRKKSHFSMFGLGCDSTGQETPTVPSLSKLIAQ